MQHNERGTMPRMTNDEYLAALEAELAETKRKAEEQVKAKIAATEAKIAAAKEKATERTKSRIEKLDEQITSAKASKAKVEERIAKLEAEREELTKTDEPSEDAEQPSLPETDEPAEVEPIKASRRAKPDAA